ncbi:MAG: hypothetical protein K2O04_05525 [Clostridiales bacterium]|nr:hypothetical protein [Clostridiales bacterium]
MLYEKKMLILSGEGKGVVLIEKSARGLRFSLSTFDMPTCGELKAGVITRKAVFVRDLPQRDNPSAVFIVEADDVSDLHFAVFDAKLRLYGTNGKRMWESNVMDLLCKNDRKAQIDDSPQLAALPPISTPPKVLPMPDGTGIPQSRLELYGDEQIAESNFYTPIDLQAHLPKVDKFLEEPRVLDGLAPMIERHAPALETTAIFDVQEVTEEAAAPAENDGKKEGLEMNINHGKAEVTVAPARAAEQSEDGAMPAAAAAADFSARPCDMEARWLLSRSKRTVRIESAAVKPVVSDAQKVKPLREVSFIERAAADVEKLFDNAEKDEKLCAMLPDIAWVKVPIDNNVISVGRGGNDFLCYAVFGTYEKVSPLGDEAQWLPENKSIPTGKGYWLIFQSLKDGKIIAN